MYLYLFGVCIWICICDLTIRRVKGDLLPQPGDLGDEGASQVELRDDADLETKGRESEEGGKRSRGRPRKSANCEEVDQS